MQAWMLKNPIARSTIRALGLLPFFLACLSANTSNFVNLTTGCNPPVQLQDPLQPLSIVNCDFGDFAGNSAAADFGVVSLSIPGFGTVSAGTFDMLSFTSESATLGVMTGVVNWTLEGSLGPGDSPFGNQPGTGFASILMKAGVGAPVVVNMNTTNTLTMGPISLSGTTLFTFDVDAPPLPLTLELGASSLVGGGFNIQLTGRIDSITVPEGISIVSESGTDYSAPAAPPVSTKALIYWGDAGADKIQRADLDGTGIQDLITGVDSPSSIALDLGVGKMYWAEEGTFPKKIQRANLDGSGLEDVIALPGSARALALDTRGGKVYWTDNTLGRLGRANLDGTGVENLVTGLTNANGIALDLLRNKVYWIESFGAILPTKIRRADLDGFNPQDVLDLTGSIAFNLALDSSSGKIYWTELLSARIQRANLDGTGVEDVITGLATPVALALDLNAGKIYWTDSGTDKIQRANLDGTVLEDIVTGLSQPTGIALELPVSLGSVTGHWPFDDGQNPTEDVGGGHDGTLIGGASFVVQDLGGTQDDLPPLLGNGDAISLPVGTNAFVAIGDPPELAIAGDLTITAWVKPSATNTIDHLVTRRAGCGSALGYQLLLDSTNELVFSDSESLGPSLVRFSGLFVPDDQWSFVASVFHADTETLDFYLNDTSTLGVPAGPLGDPAGADVQIGQADGCGSSTHFDGLIDEVRIYSAALSPAAIDGLFRGNLVPLPPIADAGPDVAVECTSHAGGLVTLDGSGSSDPNGDPIVSYEWRDGGGSVIGSEAQVNVSLPLGVHVITLTVEDSTGASSAPDTVVVNVLDTTPPTLQVAETSISVPQTTGIGAVVDAVAVAGAVATDLCDPNPIVLPDSPWEFPLGSTDVSIRARDATGNQSPPITVTVEVLSSTPITDLGTLGGLGSSAVDVNDFAVVVGHISRGSGEPDAFAWAVGTGMQNLGALGGRDALAVNSAGLVTGQLHGVPHAYVWTPQGGLQDVGTLGGTVSIPHAVNSASMVVGESSTATGVRHAFAWTAQGGLQDLGTLGGASSAAFAVNSEGLVVGSSQTATGVTHAFAWTAQGGIQDLGTLGGDSSAALAVNSEGLVVGESRTSLGELHGFAWTAQGGMQDLGTLGRDSRARDVNDLGQVVGFSRTLAGLTHAFIWTAADGMRDLGTLGGGFAQAVAINQFGQVVGSSATSSGEPHATLWTTLDIPDFDADSIPDPLDNCPTLYNPDQTDLNNDGFGDACVSANASIGNNVQLGEGVIIGDGATLKSGAFVGDGTVIQDGATVGINAVVGSNTVVGQNAWVKQGAQVGSDTQIGDGAIVGISSQVGNGVTLAAGAHVKQGAVVGDNVVVGENAIVGDNVQVGAGSAIGPDTHVKQGSTLGTETFLGTNVIIGLSVELGDRVQVGDRTEIRQNTTVGADSQIGTDGDIRKSVEIGEHVTIGNFVTVLFNATIPNDASIPDGTTVP